MLVTSISILGSLLAMAPSVTAHISMAQPVPFGDPDTSPLSSDGSNYPCKMVGGVLPAATTMNNFKVGEQQTLSFKGSAVHGGGSCQLAVTLDKTPTKDSKFKVIHSIEGACPGVSGASTFNFEVPKELPNGEAVFAWTWMNRIGNREMYMNCAPITVSGGSDDKAAFEGLPDMAIANVNVGAGATCKTKEAQADYTFENPGKYTQRVGSGPFVDLCSGAASAGDGNGSGSNPQASAPAPSNGQGSGNNGLYTPPASQAPAATSKAPAATSQAPAATSQAPAATSQAPAATSQAPAATSSSSAVTSTVRTLVTVTASSGAQSQTAAPTQAPAPGAGTSGTACSTEGEVVCNGADQWGLCDHGKVVFQAVAPGTKCEGGKVAKREFTHRMQRTTI